MLSRVVARSARPANIQAKRHLFSTQTGGRAAKAIPHQSKLGGAICLASGLALGFGVYYNKDYLSQSLLTSHSHGLVPALCATESSATQDNVFSGTKLSALYLTIHLKPNADVNKCARAVAVLPDIVEQVSPPKDIRDEENEVLAGVGFSNDFYTKLVTACGGKLAQSPEKNFGYQSRKGKLGEMPASGGDIFIHAKCNNQGTLYELAQNVVHNLPADSVDRCEDIYGFVYRNGRDLSGFIDGTENAADEDSRREIAVNSKSGGSYAITQKWLHNISLIRSEKDKTLEGWVGRARSNSVEQSRKSVSSHVARMTGGNKFENPKLHQIVRQSQPFGQVSGDTGLFFIGYSAQVEAFNWMLDRMVGSNTDGQSDDIMNLSRCVQSNYYYFPGVQEMKVIRNA